MIRGSTPTHTFSLPISTDLIKSLRLTYVQSGRTVLEKTEKEVRMNGKQISLKLTQEETLAFDISYRVKIQLKVLTADGSVLVSQIFEQSAESVLNEEVLK